VGRDQSSPERSRRSASSMSAGTGCRGRLAACSSISGNVEEQTRGVLTLRGGGERWFSLSVW
jgi:hypothetical protein